MNKVIKYILCIASILIILSACDKDSKSNMNKKTITINNTYEFRADKTNKGKGEMQNNKVEVPINPTRVAVMDYGALDIMKQMGLENKIVSISKGKGMAFLPHSLEEFKDNKYINLGNPGQPDYKALAKSKPEIIFTSFRQAHTKTLDELKKAAPNAKIVFISPNNSDYIASIKESTTIIGKIFEKEDKAKQLNAELTRKVEEVKKTVDNSKVLFLSVDDKGIKAFNATGRFGGFLTRDLGIKYADTAMKENVGGNLISYEYLNKVNPDKLYVIDRSNNGTDKQLPKLLHTDIIKNMKAVKNKQVYQFEANAWFFSEGGIKTTIKQLDDIEATFKK